MHQLLSERLEKQEKNQRHRERRVLTRSSQAEIRYQDKNYLSFCSNDYLGLAAHPDLIKALHTSALHYGVGSGSSALISGYTPAHQELEIAFAEFLGRDRALFFGSGTLANLGCITALMQTRDDRIYQDKFNHASLIDAALLSKAKLQRYPHHDLSTLESLLKNTSSGLNLIASESVFSMDGSQTNLREIARISTEAQALLMMDDAHGIGILGHEAKSVAGSLNQDECPLIAFSLGKAFGCYGAIVAGKEVVIENILQLARSYIYTTAPPPALASAALAALKLVQTEDWRREKLVSLIFSFKKKLGQIGLELLDSDTAIQSIVIGDSAKAQQLSAALLEEGIFIRDIRPPTVPEGQARLRITLNAMHSEGDIDRLVLALTKIDDDI